MNYLAGAVTCFGFVSRETKFAIMIELALYCCVCAC